MLLVHHLAVDGVSWRILLDDLAAAAGALSAGREPALAPVPTSVRRWAARLATAATAPERAAEVPLWTQLLGGGRPLPVRRPVDPETDVLGADPVTVTLPVGTTRALLTAAPAAHGAGVDDVLLAALGLALDEWRARLGDGPGATVVAVQTHGREEQVADADLSRTVGWLADLVPVLLDTGGAEPDAASVEPTADPAGAVARVAAGRDRLPDGGAGYSLLRYLNPATGPALAAAGQPDVTFNYEGRFERPAARDWASAPESDEVFAAWGADRPAHYALAVFARTADRPDGPVLTAEWHAPAGVLPPDAVRDLAQAWVRALTTLADHRPDGRQEPVPGVSR
jgi:non-ribosomal peptide synthase protein (TIGR01720 family)